MPYWILALVFIFLLLPGFLGIFLPFLPSIPYMFIVALIFSLVDKFEHLTPFNLIILGLIAIISIVIDYTAGIVGAYGGGASKGGLFGGLLGGLIGVVFFPPWGLILGMLLGVIIFELFFHRDRKKILKATTGVVFGSLAGMVINLILVILFFGLFILFVWH